MILQRKTQGFRSQRARNPRTSRSRTQGPKDSDPKAPSAHYCHSVESTLRSPLPSHSRHPLLGLLLHIHFVPHCSAASLHLRACLPLRYAAPTSSCLRSRSHFGHFIRLPLHQLGGEVANQLLQHKQQQQQPQRPRCGSGELQSHHSSPSIALSTTCNH